MIDLGYMVPTFMIGITDSNYRTFSPEGYELKLISISIRTEAITIIGEIFISEYEDVFINLVLTGKVKKKSGLIIPENLNSIGANINMIDVNKRLEQLKQSVDIYNKIIKINKN